MSLLQTKLFFRLKKGKGKVNSDSEKVIKNGPVYKPIYLHDIVIYSDVKDINGTFKINFFWEHAKRGYFICISMMN